MKKELDRLRAELKVPAEVPQEAFGQPPKSPRQKRPQTHNDKNACRKTMIERHSIDFDWVIFNVVSDADRHTMTLQFESNSPLVRQGIRRILRAIEQRFGNGIASRLRRWHSGQGNPFVLPAGTTTHPEYGDVLFFEIGVKPGVRMEDALASLLDHLRQLPGFKRIYGPPLDRDQPPPARIARLATPPAWLKPRSSSSSRHREKAANPLAAIG